jgi:hypothetical protein
MGISFWNIHNSEFGSRAVKPFINSGPVPVEWQQSFNITITKILASDSLFPTKVNASRLHETYNKFQKQYIFGKEIHVQKRTGYPAALQLAGVCSARLNGLRDSLAMYLSSRQLKSSRA